MYGGGWWLALPEVNQVYRRKKKDLPTNIALRYSWVFFGYRLGKLWGV